MSGYRLIAGLFSGLRPSAFLAAIVAFASLSSCSDLTSVDTLDVVQPTDLENPSGARALQAGAIGLFADAYSGAFHNIVILSGRVADEFYAAKTGDSYDRREIPEFSTFPIFRILPQARMSLLYAIRAMQRFNADSVNDIAELFALLAYTELFYGESFCSGIPLSSFVGGRPRYGKQLTTAEMFARSLTHFDSAVAYARSGGEAAYLARVGRARALLSMGFFADAASSVANVPTGFVYEISHGLNTQQNGIWDHLYVNVDYTVADGEGGTGLAFVTALDPRVSTELVGAGADGHTPVYALEKYASASAPVVLASGVEARLIEAEALLNARDATGALARLNGLRETVPRLDPLTLEPTTVGRVDQLFHERAFWLFATGHRQGDLRRLIRQYGRDADSVFPSGPYRDGLSYGNEVTLAFHVTEPNNPHFTGGCLNRDA